MGSDPDTMLLRAIADRVVALRLDKGWTQDDLVDESGVTRRMVQGIEREGRNPSVVTLARIARAFGLSLPELLQGVE